MVNVALKTRHTAIKLAPEQYRLLQERAESCGMRLAVWMRLILVQAASQKPRKGYLHIREPNGDTI